MADESSANSFFFADHLVFEDSSSREFYRSILQGLVHKNNNVFGVIQGYSSLILMDEVPPPIKENVEQIRESANIGSDLSKIILTACGFARVSPEPISLSDLLPHIEQTARETCESKEVSLSFQANPELPAVLADGAKLVELLGELIKNAAESAAGQSGGEVAVDILPPGEASAADLNQVDIFIRNSSADLTPEQVEKAFEPFHGSKGSSHSGLGLTAAAILAGQMRMRLGLRNSEGTTTAWLSIPVAE